MQRHNSDPDDNDKTAVTGDVVHGHKIGGDQYNIGDMKNVEGVAIGNGARAEINHYTEIIVKLDTIEDLPPAPGEPPYKGLAYFTEKDAKIYYGRETLSQQISTRLSQQHFLALIGASGSGKSSLLRAGIIPRLREQNWLIHVITPGKHPLGSLTNELARNVNSLDFAPKLEKMMRQKAETLHLMGSKFASRKNAPRMLLAVDQFEEVFTQCHDEEERRAFVENLLTAANKGGSVTILIGLRADFYDRCAHFEGLRELVSQQQEFIGPLNQQELVRVIAEPAKQGKWQFVEGLVEQIIEDAGQEPGRLPLLSHALRETWERRRGMAMTLAGYRAAGGVEGAIAKTAEEVFGRFDDGETAVAQSVFLSLTELGEGAEDTRRIAPLAELEEANADKPLDGVLQTLVNARLITTGEGQVEVAHEALIRRWPRLHGWLADNRERLRFERQLSQDANEWEELGRDVGALYRGARLQQAIELVEKGKIEVRGGNGSFLTASREESERESREKEAQRQRELAQAKELVAEAEARRQAEALRRKDQSRNIKRLRVFSGVLAIVFFIAVGAAILASNSRQDAIRERDTAESLRLAAESPRYLDDQYDLALLLSVEARKRSDSMNVRASQLTALMQNPNLINYFHGHTAPVTSIAFSHDTKLLATGDRAGNLFVWDIENRSERYRIETGHVAPIMDIAFSADDSKLVTLSYHLGNAMEDAELGQVMVWNVSTKERIIHMDDATLAFVKGTVSSDGKYLALLNEQNETVVWDVQHNQLDTTLRQSISDNYHNSNLDFMATDSRLLWQISNPNGYAGEALFGVWDWNRTHELEYLPLIGHANGINNLVASPNGLLVASGDHSGLVVLNDAEYGFYLNSIQLSSWYLTTVKRGIALTDSQLALGDSDGEIFIYEAENDLGWQETNHLRGHSGSVSSLDFADDSNLLASGGEDGKVILWDLGQNRLRQASIGKEIVFSPSGQKVATLLSDGIVKFLDTHTFSPLPESVVFETGFWQLWNFLPDEQHIVGYGENGLGILDVQTGITKSIIAPDAFQINRAAEVTVSSDGRYIVLMSDRGQEQPILYDLEIDQQLPSLTKGNISADFHPDGRMLVTGSTDGKLSLWNTDEWKLIQSPIVAHMTDWVMSVVFSSDGNLLASGGADRIIRIWNVESDNISPAISLIGHTSMVRQLAFSPNGDFLASYGDDDLIILWDVVSGRQIAQLHVPDYIGSLAFNPNPDTLQLAYNNNLLDLDEINWIEIACQTANRNLSYSELDTFMGSDKEFVSTCPE